MNPESNTFETSRMAYLYCLDHGLISQRVAEVLLAINEGGRMNQTMVHQAIIRKTGKIGLEKYSISPRFAVLERMGLIRQTGTQPCPVSKRATVFYEATNTKPTCTESQAMSNAGKREMVSALKARVKELELDVKQLRELMNMKSASFAEREKRIKEAPTEEQQPLF